MSEEKITGVLVDIPTVILRAKNERKCESLIELLNQNIQPCMIEYISPKIPDGWTRVAERMPENPGEYLCIDRYGEYCLAEIAEGDRNPVSYMCFLMNIERWMPLAPK